MIGKLLGNRYEIIEQLGGGGMAVVYKGKDSFLNRLVTIKVLRSEFAADDEFVKSFRREAQAIASLSHPNIVNIHDVGHEGDIQYLVMEYVDGDNLKNLIKSKGILSPSQAIEIAVQVCDALEHAHEHNIIHRDVKPHNILITTTGKAKLTDFGIARETTGATITQSDTVVGSVHYLSPEQARGEEADRKSDIYSLGAVMYEMLTGNLPFTGDNPVAVALKHVKEEPVPLRDVNPDVPFKLQEVVLKAMSKNPEQRQESAREMARELMAVDVLSPGGADDLDATRLIPVEDFKTRILPTVKLDNNKPAAVGENKQRAVKRKRNDRNSRPVIWAALALVLFGLTVAGALALQSFLNVPEVRVPNVTGKTYEDAKSILERNGLRVAKVTKYDDKIPAGTVISQSKGPGDPPVKKNQNRVITLVVSRGPETVSVPNIVGKNKREAEALLSEKGLSLIEASPVFSNMEKGKIVEQQPGAGKSVPRGSEITVFVSKGPKPAMRQVPGLIGKTLDEAKAILARENLKISTSYQQSDEYVSNQVIAQNPEEGTTVQEGSTVNVVLSQGATNQEPGDQGNGGSDQGPGTVPQNARVELNVPNDGQEHTVKIQVTDSRGMSVPYVNTHQPGDKVATTVSYYGKATIRVYLDSNIVSEKSVN